jgi:Family of unknown function (DUF5330)
MFFVKLAFWLGLVVLLLPSDEQQQARLYGTATTAVERVTTFCDRNARTCTMSAEAWSTFLKKAEFGARLVGDLISSGSRQMGADAPQPPPQSLSENTKTDPRGTLSPMDMQPAWRGPGRRAGT